MRRRLTKKDIKFLDSVKNLGLEEAKSVYGVTDDVIRTKLVNKNFADIFYDSVGLSAKQIKFLEIYEKKMLNVKQSCKAVGIARGTFYNWRESNKVFADLATDIEEGLYDDVETVLHQKIFMDKDTSSIIWFTRTKMQSRGYVDTQNINTNVSGSLGIVKELEGKSLEELDEIENELRNAIERK